MIRPQAAFAFLMALALSFLLFVAEVAYGEEDPTKEDTPAAKAFRDAWWAETGAGALDKALEGYRAAVDAKGSDAIRARALYRQGLVLQRMGKMDEALAAMKRLATEFPGEGALLAKAKQRLDEWTAIDLREQFPEWYRRYQYSPEFQAKIVDLVLKLGAPNNQVQKEAQQELLTIGEPAIPALQQHAGSANSSIRRTVMEILLDLGRLPPADSLFKSSGWRKKKQFWTLLHGADDPTRSAYRAAADANTKDFRAAWVLASLNGETAVAAAARGKDIEGGDANSFVYSLLDPWLADEPSGTLTSALREAIFDPEVSGNMRAQLAKRMHAYHDYDSGEPHPFGLTPDEVVRWIESDHSGVQQAALQYLRSGQLHTQAVLDATTAYILAQPKSISMSKDPSGALLGILRMRTTMDGLDGAVDAAARLLEGAGWNRLDSYPLQNWGPAGRGSNEMPLRVLARAITKARGNQVKGSAVSWFHRGSPITLDERWAQLIAWSTKAQDEAIRRESIRHAAQHARGNLEQLTAPVAGADTPPDFARDFMQGLYGNRDHARLAWNEETVTRLLEVTLRDPYRRKGNPRARNWTVAGKTIRVRMPYGSPHAGVLMNLIHDGPHTATFFRAAVQHPQRFDGSFWQLLGEEWKESEVHRAMARKALSDGWARWSVEERETGLRALLQAEAYKKGDEATDALLRRCLASEGNSPAVRSLLLEYVSELTLEDVRGAFDFTNVAEVDAAAALVRMLPATREVFDAFLPALRPDGEGYGVLAEHFDGNKDETLVRELITRLLAHETGDANAYATSMLVKRNRAEDLAVWVEALSHRAASVRKLAAGRLGRLYNQAAIRALAKAVDDADPDVRDAALASLERIQKTEEQKEYWRRFGKEGGKPGDGK